MPKFEVSVGDRKFEVDAPSLDVAQQAVTQQLGGQPQQLTQQQREEQFGVIREPNIFERRGVGPVARTVANIPGSLAEFGKNIAQPFIHPIQTAKGLKDVAAGAAAKVLPEEVGGIPVFAADERQQQAASQVGEFFSKRFGGPERISRTIQTDPIGAMLDLSTIFSGVGAVPATGKAGQITQAFGKAGKALEPIRLSKKMVIKTNKALGTGKLFEGLADWLTSSSKLISKTTAKKIAKSNFAGEDPAKWLNDRRISGTRGDITKQLESIHKESKFLVDKQLASVDNVFTDAASNKMLSKLSKVMKDDISDVQRVKFQRVNELQNKLKKEGLTLSEMNEIKRLGDDQLNIFNKSGDARSLDMSLIRDELKTSIELKAAKNGLPKIRQLNKDTQISKEIIKGIEGRALSAADNRIFSLTDVFVGSLFGATSGLATGLGIVVGKRVLESPFFKTALASRLRQLSGSDIAKIEAFLANPESSRFAKSFVAKIVSEATQESVALNQAAAQAGRLERVAEGQL